MSNSASPGVNEPDDIEVAINVLGHNGDRIIENHFDGEIEAQEGAKAGARPAGHTFGNKFKFAGNKLVELTENEGADWPYVKRAPVVGGNWKSNGDMGFISAFPETGINTA